MEILSSLLLHSYRCICRVHSSRVMFTEVKTKDNTHFDPNRQAHSTKRQVFIKTQLISVLISKMYIVDHIYVLLKRKHPKDKNLTLVRQPEVCHTLLENLTGKRVLFFNSSLIHLDKL